MSDEKTTKPGTRADGDGEAFVRKVRRATRKRYSPEEKIRIVLEGMRGEAPVAEICRREGVHVNTYHKWLKDFMEAGKTRLKGDELRGANAGEVAGLRQENVRLKELVGELSLECMALKKSLGSG